MKCPRCQIEIKDHPANACLDALFAEKVMEWEKRYYRRHKYHGSYVWATPKTENHHHIYGLFNPSTNISHAMEGVEKHKNDIYLELHIYEDEYRCWVYPNNERYAEIVLLTDSLELAITHALILWAMEKE